MKTNRIFPWSVWVSIAYAITVGSKSPISGIHIPMHGGPAIIPGTQVSMTSGYAPTQAMCPSNGSMIREASSMSPSEVAWMNERHIKTEAAIREYLNRVGVEYTQARFDSNNRTRPINIALAFSGGGLRAMLTAAGELAALDNRTANATEMGLGGVLQSSSYIAGLSGGSWLLASLMFQNWPTVDEMVLENPYNVWDFSTWNTIVNTTKPWDLVYDFAANDYNKILERLAFWNMPSNKGIKSDMVAKQNAGFPVSVTDAWGRMLAHSLFRMGPDNWQDSATWSGIREMQTFANHNMPFPVVTALARRPGTINYNMNSPIIEFNPYEMGSFDTSINTFYDIKYLGTPVVDGVPMGNCQTGFDNAAFIVGTSSSVFNHLLNTVVCPTCTTLNSVLKFFVKRFLQTMSQNRQDVAWYDPNPFYGSRYAHSSTMVTSNTLFLMDGGIAGEVIPLSTISVKERALDLVFAFDNDGPEWPDGTSLINTYRRQFSYEGKSTLCPYVPGQSTFLHYNLTAKPTFFGCNARNLTALAKGGVIPPLIIYIANRPYEFYSNTSTLKLTYTDNEKKGMVTNGFDIAAQGNKTATPDWQTCVGCAMVRRAEERNNVTQSDVCRQCFQKYCWDGKTYENATYVPPVNFTNNGLTNEPMTLDVHNAYIHKKSLMTKLLDKIVPVAKKKKNKKEEKKKKKTEKKAEKKKEKIEKQKAKAEKKKQKAKSEKTEIAKKVAKKVENKVEKKVERNIEKKVERKVERKSEKKVDKEVNKKVHKKRKGHKWW